MNHRYGKISSLITALVFLCFAMCALMVVLMGAGVYQRLTERNEAQYAHRVPGQYLSTRIRQAQFVTAGEFDSLPALHLWEELEGETYVTRVYLYDGYLRELFSTPGAKLSPEDGEKILPITSLSFAQEDSLLQVCINDRALYFQLPTGKEASP